MGTSNPVDVGRLTSNEVETFRREGFLLYPEPIFSEDKFRRLVEHFEGLLEKWPKDERPEGMDVPHFSDPALFEWLLSSFCAISQTDRRIEEIYCLRFQ